MPVENDLAELKGIGPKYAELLKSIGVDSIKELSHRNAGHLKEMIETRRRPSARKFFPDAGPSALSHRVVGGSAISHRDVDGSRVNTCSMYGRRPATRSQPPGKPRCYLRHAY
jgi:hypothetical protein